MEFHKPVVSIIMPAYNAGLYIHEAIQSVIDQTFKSWQLIVINDGSVDDTEKIITNFDDPRIVYLKQKNKGVSAARNAGLDQVVGDFVCFLDADDVMPPNSLRDRLEHLTNNPSVDFVDGTIHVTNRQIHDISKTWTPSFRGLPQPELVQLTGRCFVTISWMMRKEVVANVRFKEGLTHAEDLIFLVEISPNRVYDYISSPVLFFRRTGNSAMSNMDGLAAGYLEMLETFTKKNLFLTTKNRNIYKIKMMKIMFLCYLKIGEWRKAIKFVLKTLFV